MASSGGMKGFYKQQKKKNGGSGISKPKPSPSDKSLGLVGTGSRSGSDKAEMGLHAVEEEEEEEEEESSKLRAFDLDMRYGPCIGLTRMERWDRASSMGLNPPPHIESILLQSNPTHACCLWEGRV